MSKTEQKQAGTKARELNDDELNAVTGGFGLLDWLKPKSQQISADPTPTPTPTPVPTSAPGSVPNTGSSTVPNLVPTPTPSPTPTPTPTPYGN